MQKNYSDSTHVKKRYVKYIIISFNTHRNNTLTHQVRETKPYSLILWIENAINSKLNYCVILFNIKNNAVNWNKLSSKSREGNRKKKLG